MSILTRSKLQVQGPMEEGFGRILTPEALDFLADLVDHFETARQDLLTERIREQEDYDRGNLPIFLDSTREVREADWRVAATPHDLEDRRVEITGPAERKMMINALNSGAQVFMADLEDALSPSWTNVVQGQVNLYDAVRREISLETDKKTYELEERTATLMVRPRGWHLEEAHVTLDGEPISASLFDFGLYFFHNAQELLRRGSGPYFYLPKLETYQEAKLWNQVFEHAQRKLHVPQGSIRATVLIETITAVFQMEEILYELRDHSAGLNAGRWDYLFSVIKKFHEQPFVLPDRIQVTMRVPFMHAYSEQLVRACHERGAHAIGGMAAFIPNRRDREVTEEALRKVREDKEREASSGFDGTWVAHPDLVLVAREVFDRVLGDRPHQKHVLREDVRPDARALLDFNVPDGTITEEGVRTNVSVALQYLNAWLGGWGAAAINNLMEDTATAEISRAQLWQWRRRQAKLEDGRTFDLSLYRELREQELEELGGRGEDHYGVAVEVLDELVESDEFIPFLTWVAYPRLG